MAETKKKVAHPADEIPVSEVVSGEFERDYDGEINNLKREVEGLRKERDNLKGTLSQYENEYKKLSLKFNRLYSILSKTIECSLEMGVDQ